MKIPTLLGVKLVNGQPYHIELKDNPVTLVVKWQSPTDTFRSDNGKVLTLEYCEDRAVKIEHVPSESLQLDRNQMIKWLNENTTSENWGSDAVKAAIPDGCGWYVFGPKSDGGGLLNPMVAHELDEFKSIGETDLQVCTSLRIPRPSEISEVSESDATHALCEWLVKYTKREQWLNGVTTLPAIPYEIGFYSWRFDAKGQYFSSDDLCQRVDLDDLDWSERNIKAIRLTMDDVRLVEPNVKHNINAMYGKMTSKDLYPEQKPKTPPTAPTMLTEAAEQIGNRAASRDTDAERSMSTTVNAFNAMYGTEITEEQGWMFMVFLKASRAKGGAFRDDDYVDGAAYFALAGECAATERGE